MNWLKNLLAKINPRWLAWGASTLATLLAAGLIWLMTGKAPPPIIPPAPDVPIWQRPDDGWINAPKAVEDAVQAIEAHQKFPADFGRVAQEAIHQDTDEPVFLWDAEQKVLRKILDSWDQGSIGACVSMGWGRGVQDLILVQIANGHAEDWPGAEVCREAIYGGSRVQIGGGRIHGDGSIGAWAAQWVQQDGVLFYQNYPGHDLTSGYSVARCRQWGNAGCPTDLVPIAKQHPVQGVAKVSTSAEVWAALGNGYPVPICSDVGFDSPLKDVFCARRGSWSHCMLARGRFVHPARGKCFVIQNSWGDYLKSASSPNSLIDVQSRGKVQLPTGCFAVTAADMEAIVKQGDSFAISAFKGFPAQRIDWSARQDFRKDEG